MKNNILPLWMVCPIALLMLLVCQVALAAGADIAVGQASGKSELLYSIANGNGGEQMAWYAGDGNIESGHLQGPGAVLALSDELRLFADTLNYRLVLRKADSGRVVKVFDLSNTREVGLKFKPLIIDLADAGNGIVYAADEANMVIWRIDLGKNWQGPKMKVEALFSFEGRGGAAEKAGNDAAHQLSRICADRNGIVYAVDIPRQSTVSFAPDGSKKFVYEGLTNGISDRNGLLYHPIFYGEASVREMEIYDEKGRMVGDYGRLNFDRSICYIAPIGFDSEDTLYIFADSDQRGPLIVRIYRKDKKQVFTELKTPAGPWFESSTPYWTGPAGSLEWAEYDAQTLKIYRRKL